VYTSCTREDPQTVMLIYNRIEVIIVNVAFTFSCSLARQMVSE
jgi:hypothetical protein